MKRRQKQGCNQKQSAHNDVTAVSPLKTRRKLHLYVFLGIKRVGGNRNKPSAEIFCLPKVSKIFTRCNSKTCKTRPPSDQSSNATKRRAVKAEKNHGSKNSGNLFGAFVIPICGSISTEHPANPTTITKDENDMTEKNHKYQPSMRENQTPEPTDDQYGPFTEEEFDTLILRACKHGATDEEMATFLNWARSVKIKSELLNLIQGGALEISGYKDDGTFVMKLPDNPPPRCP